ncbi:hypothetical protein [Actinomycetospora chibensis]|uniref:Uncharacterized protein n=1 Tax=Actinomycetospora chibensis TaxID=663606 RepID=A0ABV9RLZ1_9PSEU|nr:hypothetical protein [Actinomycetospora chibensis]MDD7926944.1 hypothetical protein [Actinomycetospora chibensis]
MPAVEHTRHLEHRSGRSHGPGAHRPGLFARLREKRARREYEASVVMFANSLRGVFREACAGIGLCQYVSVASGITVRTPRVGEVRLGPPTSLTVELMAGQEPGDFTAKDRGPRLAHTLGAHGLRVEPIAGRWVRLHLLDHDPLRDGYGLPSLTLASVHDPVIIGRTENGLTLGHALSEAGHLGVQGQNASATARCARPPTSSARPSRPAARSTAPRPTAPSRRSCARPTAHPSTGSTSSAAPPTPAAASPSSPCPPRSPPG